MTYTEFDALMIAYTDNIIAMMGAAGEERKKALEAAVKVKGELWDAIRTDQR